MKTLSDATKTGNGLYQDESKRKYLIDYRRKKAYLVLNDEVKKYELFRSRYVVVLMVFIIVEVYAGWSRAIIAGIVSFVLAEIAYYHNFLPSLTEIKGVQLPEKQTQYDVMKKGTKAQNIKRFIASLLLVVVIIASAYYFVVIKNDGKLVLSMDNIFILLLSGVFCVISLLNAYYSGRVLQKREYINGENSINRQK